MRPFYALTHHLISSLLLSALLFGCSASKEHGTRIFHPHAVTPPARPGDFDLQHLLLTIDIDHLNGVVSGSAEHRVRLLDPTLDSLLFDAGPAVTVEGVTIDGDSVGYSYADRLISVPRPTRLMPGEEAVIQIRFRSSGSETGIYFRYREEGEIGGRDMVYTQGEPTEHHEWFPLSDRPSDLATTETIVTIRDDWSLMSNGDLIEVGDPVNGKRTWHYRMEKPHALYLLAIVAGDFLITNDTTPGVRLEYWSYKDMPERVAPTFGATGDIIQYYDSLLGLAYPWGVYRQVVVDEYMYGGMENTTATVLSDYLLVDSTIKIDLDPTSTVAHEVVHQWFGDLVTIREWPHLWIHESFATYLAARYIGSRFGEDKFDETIGRYHRTAFRMDREGKGDPIALGANQTNMIYGRGAAVLHMLNCTIGDAAFTAGMRLFLKKHQHTVVVTSDLQRAFEEASGESLQWFFDQWVYGKDHPVVEIDSEVRGDSVRYRIRQEPRRGNAIEIFRLPMEIVMVQDRGDGSVEDNLVVHRDTVELGEKSHTTEWLPNHPSDQFINVAPGAGVLLEKKYDESIEESWDRMHIAASSFDREEAALSVQQKMSEAVGKMSPDQLVSIGHGVSLRFAEEPSPAVRIRLLEIGAFVHNAVSLDIIRMAIGDPDPDVREASLAYHPLFGKRTIREEYGELLNDPSYVVQAKAIYTFIDAGAQLNQVELQRFSEVLGTQQRVATAFARVVGVQNERRYLDKIVEYAIGGGSWLRAESLKTIGTLGLVTDRVRDAIVAGILSQNERLIKEASLSAKRLDDPDLNLRINDEIAKLSKERRKEIEEAGH